ncbi:unnamed protein product, partial [Discosporangium mesarthrocarpum]
LLQDLLGKLRRRNRLETEPFKHVFEAHRGLVLANESLRQQTVAQDKEIIILRHKLTEGLTQGESSDALRNMQEELQRLQGQVTDKYRSQAEATSEQLRLVKEVQVLQEELKRCRDSLEKLQVEHGDNMARCKDLEDKKEKLQSSLALQQNELGGLRELLEGKEAENLRLTEALKTEREELVTRLLKDKESMLEEMNRMNESNQSLMGEKAALSALLSTGSGGSVQAQQSRSRSSSNSGTMGDRQGPGIFPAWLLSQDTSKGWGLGSGTGGGTGGANPTTSPASGVNLSGDGPPAVPSRRQHSAVAHMGGVNDVAFGVGGMGSGTGGLLATAGDNACVNVWDPSSARLKATLKGKQGVAMMAVSVHGEVAAGGGSDGSCTLWNHRSGREKARLTGHQQKV